jgi:hypothetical protein
LVDDIDVRSSLKGKEKELVVISEDLYSSELAGLDDDEDDDDNDDSDGNDESDDKENAES